MFHCASNTVINGGEFNTVYIQVERSTIQILYDKLYPEALHNFSERRTPSKHSQAQKDTVSDIIEWVINPADDTALRLLWLNGPMRAKNTAIAQEISAFCHENDQLGATFFFPHDTSRRGCLNKFCSTLAYQLASSQPEVLKSIGELVARDPSILDRSWDTQFQRLIVEPLALIEKAIIIVIDGLDACTEEGLQRPIMDLLTSTELPLVRFIVTSGSTTWIREGLSGVPLVEITLPEHGHPSSKGVRGVIRQAWTRASEVVRKIGNCIQASRPGWCWNTRLEET